MSKTYSIACKDCKVHLWCAQGSHSDKKKGHLYAKYSKDIFEFLIDHQGHNLIFDSNCVDPISDYKEISVR